MILLNIDLIISLICSQPSNDCSCLSNQTFTVVFKAFYEWHPSILTHTHTHTHAPTFLTTFPTLTFTYSTLAAKPVSQCFVPMPLPHTALSLTHFRSPSNSISSVSKPFFHLPTLSLHMLFNWLLYFLFTLPPPHPPASSSHTLVCKPHKGLSFARFVHCDLPSI